MTHPDRDREQDLIGEIRRLSDALDRIDQEVANWVMERDAPYLFLLLVQDLALRALNGEQVDPDLLFDAYPLDI